MCTMMPWNFLISVTSFWDFKFRNVTYAPGPVPLPTGPPVPMHDHNDFPYDDDDDDGRRTAMQVAFPSYLAIASNIPGAMTTLAHSIFGQRVRWVRSKICYGFLPLCFVDFTQSSYF